MSSDYYYKRTEDYKKIRYHEMVGEHKVPMVHSAVLIDLKKISSDLLTFNKTKLNSYHDRKSYNGPIDDIIIFAMSANFSNTEMIVSNSQAYGHVLVPLDLEDSISKDIQQVVNTRVAIVNHFDSVNILPEFAKFVTYPETTKLGFSEVYMIKLTRRP